MNIDLPDECPYCGYQKFTVEFNAGKVVHVQCDVCGLDPDKEELLKELHVHFEILKDGETTAVLPGLKESGRYKLTESMELHITDIHPAYECLL